MSFIENAGARWAELQRLQAAPGWKLTNAKVLTMGEILKADIRLRSTSEGRTYEGFHRLPEGRADREDPFRPPSTGPGLLPHHRRLAPLSQIWTPIP